MENNHEAELNRHINSGDPLNFMLSNGMMLTGVVNWQDDQFISVEGSVEGAERICTISKSQLVCYYEYVEGDDRYATIDDI